MKPLAYRIRPKVFEDIVGQDHLVGPTGVIRKMMDANQLCSMILYGPEGLGGRCGGIGFSLPSDSNHVIEANNSSDCRTIQNLFLALHSFPAADPSINS